MTMELNGKIPEGPLEKKWELHRFNMKLVNPANRRKYHIIVVGTGLAGSSAAASLAELGYNVTALCCHESPRRAHSIAAQGGINAPKNYANDGDSVYRLFYDTVKGGDYRSREANVYRLAQVSNSIIDQCVAQGVPFAREYGGLLETRSFGGTQVSRTFFARGQTGQQLLLGAYQSLSRQIGLGGIRFLGRREMLDLIVIDGQARGILVRNLLNGGLESIAGDAVILATGGYSNVFFLSTNARMSNASAIWRAYKRGAFFANPCFTQIHPTCIPVSSEHQAKLTLMSESLRNDGRIWVPKTRMDKRDPNQIPEDERDYYLERIYPAFGNLTPRDVASRRAKDMCDRGFGAGATGKAVFLDFSDTLKRHGKAWVVEKYGNLFDMYQEITGEDAYATPMRIYPAVHYTMGGLWIDYNMMSSVPGLFVLGEANFSDHGANRLGASALMQGLADGYFIIPYTLGDYLAGNRFKAVDSSHNAFKDSERAVAATINKLFSIAGNRAVEDFHKELGEIMWNYCGMARNAEGLKKALELIPQLREQFWSQVRLPGRSADFNQEIEKALRVADFLELGQLMVEDALQREESCGCHFREEYETEDGEAKRDDARFSFVAAWEFQGEGMPRLHKEPLSFEAAKPSQRSYK
jgi:succinate dehydrogenase / fumarate reductase, flavoprotein subunit